MRPGLKKAFHFIFLPFHFFYQIRPLFSNRGHGLGAGNRNGNLIVSKPRHSFKNAPSWNGYDLFYRLSKHILPIIKQYNTSCMIKQYSNHCTIFPFLSYCIKKQTKKERITNMANYHTASDCGCSQNTPQCPMPEKPCPAPMPRRQMMQKPCPADMPGRQMMHKPCSAGMSGRQMMQRSCPADIPQPKMPDCPSMPGNCHGDSDPLSDMPIAMAYVPWQFFHETFDVDKALQCGTIFPELSKPFLGKGGCPK